MVSNLCYVTDVVFDPELLPPLCTLLSELLHLAEREHGRGAVAYVASTIRSEVTHQHLLRELGREPLRVIDVQ